MSRLAQIVESFPGKRIVVIGDAIADQFIYGEISRVSREAPVFILRHEHTETTPGGAGNCAANLAALGAKVELMSVLGNDDAGKILYAKLREAGVGCDGVSVSGERRTTTKVRVLAGQIHSTRQQVIRIDYDNEPDFSAELQEMLSADRKLMAGFALSDAVASRTTGPPNSRSRSVGVSDTLCTWCALIASKTEVSVMGSALSLYDNDANRRERSKRTMSLRASQPVKGVRIVALTGYSQQDDRRKSREAGFDAHLVKPVAVDDLGRALEP